METILSKYPELTDTGEYIQFECEACAVGDKKVKNGTTIHKDGEKSVVVCGVCWAKKEL